jgi:ATP-binding cassette subfamily B protein
MMPVDHLLLAESEALPAIVVVRLPSGLTHFVVVWRAHGPFVQIMDPARGRRWVRRAAFLRDVYVHTMAVPASSFSDWARSDGFTAPLVRRLRALSVENAEALVERARDEPGWAALASLDAAVRAVTALVAAEAVVPGGEARRLVERLADPSGPAGRPPAAHTTGTEAPAAEDGSAQVMMRGAVLVRIGGARPLAAAERTALPRSPPRAPAPSSRASPAPTAGGAGGRSAPAWP